MMRLLFRIYTFFYIIWPYNAPCECYIVQNSAETVVSLEMDKSHMVLGQISMMADLTLYFFRNVMTHNESHFD